MRRRVVLIVAVGLVLAVPLVIWRLATLPPSWWAPPEAASMDVQALASRAESAVMEEATHVREAPDPWMLRLTEPQVNAWLVARLPEWIANQGYAWPVGVAPPQVRIEPRGISIAMQVPEIDRARFVEVRLRPAFVDGQLHLRLERAALGRIPMPGEPLEYVATVLGEAGPNLGLDLDTLERLVEVLGGRTGVEPAFRLGDGRTVRVVGLRCHLGAIELTCQTVAREPDEAPP